MGFTVKSYDVLKDEFENGVKELMGYHRVDKEEKLPAERQKEIQFLRASLNKLDESPGKNSAKTFTGLAYLFKEIIADTYTYRSPDNSKFHGILTRIIGVTEENKLEGEDIFSLSAAAMKFVSDQIFTAEHSKKVMLEDTIYSEIDGYGVSTDKKLESLDVLWQKGNAILTAAKNSVFDHCAGELKKAVKERNKEASKTGGHSSFWGLGGSKPTASNPPVVEENADKKAEKNCSV